MQTNSEILKLIKNTKKIANVDAVLGYNDEQENWLHAIRKKRKIKIKKKDNLTGEDDEEEIDKLRSFLLSIGYEMPRLSIVIDDDEEIVDNTFLN